LQWLFDTETGNPITTEAAVGSSGLVVVGTQLNSSGDGILFGITNGVAAWQFTVTHGASYPGLMDTPAIGNNNVVVVGSENGCIYAITNGGVQWSTSVVGDIYNSSPAISPFTGGVIFTSEYPSYQYGYVYCLSVGECFTANGPWPMYQGNAGRTGATPNATCASGPSLAAFPNNPNLSGTGFSFRASGTPWSRWAVEVSSNLTDWSLIDSAELNANGFDSSPISENTGGANIQFYQLQSAANCSPIIGYFNTNISNGISLIANPFYQVNDGQCPQNTAHGWSRFLYIGTLPDLTTVAKWNGQGFDADTYDEVLEGWFPDGDITMLPGQAIFITNNGSAFTASFAGLMPSGWVTNAIVPGTNYVSSMIPAAGLLQTDLQYKPNDGDTVGKWNGSSFNYYTYTASGWSPGEPSLSVGEGFLLINHTSRTNLWVTNFSSGCQSGSGSGSGWVVVTADPLWTDTGLKVSNGQTVIFPATGNWLGYTGSSYYGPGGNGETNYDTFVNGPQYSLIAFVCTNTTPPYNTPYYSGTTYEWGVGSYFPQPSGSNGYWSIGTTLPLRFTSDRTGELWFGFNDDAVTQTISDNRGAVAGYFTITNIP